MAISATAGAKFYIGPASPTAEDASAYAALTYKEVTSLRDLGEFGSEAEILVAKSINWGSARKLKGTRDNGTMNLICHRDPLDEGQNALKAAEATSFPYAFKVELNDKPGPDATASVFYFAAIVSSARNTLGEENTISSTTFALAISGDIIEVPAVLAD